MSNYLEKYLSNLDIHHRNTIISNCKKNKHFDEFLSCCYKLNISLFENTFIDIKSTFLDERYSRQKYVKMYKNFV